MAGSTSLVRPGAADCGGVAAREGMVEMSGCRATSNSDQSQAGAVMRNDPDAAVTLTLAARWRPNFHQPEHRVLCIGDITLGFVWKWNHEKNWIYTAFNGAQHTAPTREAAMAGLLALLGRDG